MSAPATVLNGEADQEQARRAFLSDRRLAHIDHLRWRSGWEVDEADVITELDADGSFDELVFALLEEATLALERSDKSKRRASRGDRRPCPSGEHLMLESSKRCKECNAAEARSLVIAAGRHVGAPDEVVQEAIVEVLDDHQKLVMVGNWLAAGRALDASDPGPLLVQALRDFLADQGYGTPTTCADCGRRRRVRHRNPKGARVCGTCYANLKPREECSRCHETKKVALRDGDGRAVCQSCRRKDPEVQRPCVVCGTLSLPAVRREDGPVGYCCYQREPHTCHGCGELREVWQWRDGKPVCRSCYPLKVAACRRCGEVKPVRTKRTGGRSGWCPTCLKQPVAGSGGASARVDGRACVDCGRLRPVQARLADGPRCSSCYPLALRRRGACSSCGAERRLFFWPGRCADCLGVDPGPRCRTCGLEDRIYADGECPQCALNRRVDEESAALGELGAAIAAVVKNLGDPLARMQWMRRSRLWPRFLAAARGGAVTHAMLDGLLPERQRDGSAAAGHGVEFLRAILVGAGVLEPRAEHSARFARWAEHRLAAVPSAGHRWVLARFYRERLLPTVERQAASGKATVGTVRWAQARLRTAERFLAWLQPHGGLPRLNRRLLDEWLSVSTTRFLVRDFIRWSVREHLTDLPLKASPRRVTRTPPSYVDEDARADLARRCLSDQSLSAADRVAGALVVLYGQHITRVATLRLADVRKDPARVRLGRNDWLEVPEPLDEPLARLVAAAEDVGSPWLLPGARVGRHISSDALGKRLSALGVDARAVHNSALFHLAGSVQPHALHRLLGLHPNTAARWSQVAMSVYATYWSSLLADGEDWELNADEVDDVSEGLLTDLLQTEDDQAEDV